MIRRPPRSTRTYTLFPYTTLFRSHPGIAHHLLVRGVARGAVGIFEPAEDDLLAFLCLYRGTEIVELARGDLVAPRLDVAAHPELLSSEERRVGKECDRTCRSRWSA